MREVVDARAAAAAPRVGDIDDRHALDLLQKRAGLRADALAVREVAGILVRDPDGPPGAPRTWLQDLAEIADARREPLRPVGPGGVVREELAVVLHMRPAAGGVDDDLRIAPREGVDVQPRELASSLAVAGVGVQSTA